jgi:putative phosphoesterase
MKILVLSDTHGHIERAEAVIRQNRKADLIIHLGDNIRDADDLSYIFPEIIMERVKGNCDFVSPETPSEKLLEYMGVRIFITHGNTYSVKNGYSRLIHKSEQVDADLVLFGHTHVAETFAHGKAIFLNPGSLSEPRSGHKPSYSTIELKEGKTPDTRIIYVE